MDRPVYLEASPSVVTGSMEVNQASCAEATVGKLQAQVYDILLWRKVPESDARSVSSFLF